MRDGNPCSLDIEHWAIGHSLVIGVLGIGFIEFPFTKQLAGKRICSTTASASAELPSHHV